MLSMHGWILCPISTHLHHYSPSEAKERYKQVRSGDIIKPLVDNEMLGLTLWEQLWQHQMKLEL